MTSRFRDSGDSPPSRPTGPTWIPSARGADRRVGSGRPPAPTGRQPPPAGRQPRVLFITWTPIIVTDRSISPSPWDFYIGQTVLREVQTRVIAKGDQALGLLLGKVHEPASGSSAPYVLIDQFLPTLETASEDAGLEETIRVLRPLQEAASIAGKTVAGWYRGHVRLGLALSDVEVRFHAERFPASWQFAFVGMSDPDRPRGAIFARNGAGDLAPATFHELLEPDSILGGGRKRTMLQWRNYGTTDRVVTSDGRVITRPRETLFAQPGEFAQPAEEPVAESPPERVAESPPERVAESPPERVAESPPEPVAESPPERVAESPPERVAEPPPERVAESVAEPPPDREEEAHPAAAMQPRWVEETPGEEEWRDVVVPLVLPDSPEERLPFLSGVWRSRGMPAAALVALLALLALAWCF